MQLVLALRCHVAGLRRCFVATVALLSCVLGACETGEAETPVDLAEAHIAYFNDGDVDGFLDGFAQDTVIGEMGTKDDPETIAAVAFALGASAGTEGYVAVCEPWGEEGAKCEGPLHDKLYEPAGLMQHKTLVYQFDEAGKIARLGAQVIHGYPDDYQYEYDLVAWLMDNYPDQAQALTEYGLVRLSGAETIETLIPLVDEFIDQSTKWPKPPEESR
jgi:hypothetical protein